jgi:hypothetical protein
MINIKCCMDGSRKRITRRLCIPPEISSFISPMYTLPGSHQIRCGECSEPLGQVDASPDHVLFHVEGTLHLFSYGSSHVFMQLRILIMLSRDIAQIMSEFNSSGGVTMM